MTAPDFTIADVLAWARTKPADERYDYQDSSNCALCQFLKDTGRSARPSVDMHSDEVKGGWRDRDTGRRGDYSPNMEPALSGDGSLYGDPKLWTFGALVERLEKLCPDAPVPPSEWTRLDAYMADIETVVAQ